MDDRIYSKPEVLLGDLRGGLCSSGLCKQLRSVAADEIERLNKWADVFSDRQLEERRTGEAYQRELTRDRDLWKERHDRERAAHAKNLTEQRKVEEERDYLRRTLDRLYGARNLPDDERIDVLRQTLGALSGKSPFSAGEKP